MIVTVTGGRDFADYTYVSNILRRCHEAQKIHLLVHGGATGADTLADQWAAWRNIERKPFAVTREEWRDIGAKAGPMRNHRMLVEVPPDLVVAFPGGTADCVRQAMSLGYRVLDLRERYNHE
jgi:NADPH:quinone reductase-like Zn-dependent oxidoreductase